MENNKNSFSIDNSSLEKMLLWAKNRINLGPDPLSGAKNLNILDLINYSELNSYFFNKPNIIRAKVPVRVSFSGGGTDFSDYMKLNSTASLTTSINKFVVASVLIRLDREIHIFSRDLDLTYKAKDRAKRSSCCSNNSIEKGLRVEEGHQEG